MKMIFKLLVLIVLLAVAPGQCFALWSVGPVSKKEAKELGMEVRSKVSGTNEVWVDLEIKIKESKDLSRGSLSQVELQFGKGETKLVSAALKEDRSKQGFVMVRFYADRSQLDAMTLRVWIYEGAGGIIHELRVKEFVELDKGQAR